LVVVVLGHRLSLLLGHLVDQVGVVVVNRNLVVLEHLTKVTLEALLILGLMVGEVAVLARLVRRVLEMLVVMVVLGLLQQ